MKNSHCFSAFPHQPHQWVGGMCEGQGINPDGYVDATGNVPTGEGGVPKSDTQVLLDGRRETYGNTVENAERVARMWNGYLGIDIITPADMMMMMALYKAYRFKVTPDYSDNINDVLGYAEIVRTVQRETGGLIDAETVKEYLAKKAQGDQSEGQSISLFAQRYAAGKEGMRRVFEGSGNPYANISDDED